MESSWTSRASRQVLDLQTTWLVLLVETKVGPHLVVDSDIIVVSMLILRLTLALSSHLCLELIVALLILRELALVPEIVLIELVVEARAFSGIRWPLHVLEIVMECWLKLCSNL